MQLTLTAAGPPPRPDPAYRQLVRDRLTGGGPAVRVPPARRSWWRKLIGRRTYRGHPLLWEPAIRQFPPLNFILAHWAWPWVWEATALALKYPNVFLDTSALYYDSPRQFFQFVFTQQVPATLIERSLRNQVIFGSNYPRVEIKNMVHALKSLPLTEGCLQKILRDNAERVLDILDKPRALIQSVPDRPGHDRRYAVDTARLRALGWQPAWSFATALEATVRWYVEHPDWWRPLRDASYAGAAKPYGQERIDDTPSDRRQSNGGRRHQDRLVQQESAQPGE